MSSLHSTRLRHLGIGVALGAVLLGVNFTSGFGNGLPVEGCSAPTTMWGLDWISCRTEFDFEETEMRISPLPQVRSDFDYGHGGNGRSPQIATNVGAADDAWENYSFSVDIETLPRDDGFNQHGLPACARAAGVGFRVKTLSENWNSLPGNTGYYFGYWTEDCGSTREGTWQLIRVDAHYIEGYGWYEDQQVGQRRVLGAGDLPLGYELATNNIKVHVFGDEMAVWFNDFEVVRVQDVDENDEAYAAISHGGISFAWTWEMMGSVSSFVLDQEAGPIPQPQVFDAGYYHNVAVTPDGDVWTFGKNEHGAIGNGSSADRVVPVRLSGLPRVREVAAGGAHTLAVGLDGSLWSWGANNSGRLGSPCFPLKQFAPAQIERVEPLRDDPAPTECPDQATPNSEDFDFVAVTAGSVHSVALDSEGKVWTWGDNKSGALGLGDAVDRYRPTQIPTNDTFNNIIAIAAGDAYTVALKHDGSVFVWGYNAYGQLGTGDKANRYEPTLVSIKDQNDNDQIVVAIATGYDHTLALTEDGTVWSWGWNKHGQLGIDNKIDQTAPVKISAFDNDTSAKVVSIAGGYYQSAAVKSDGTVWSWGLGYHHSSGEDKQRTIQTQPVQVVDLPDAVAVKAGESMTVVRLHDGSLMSWGEDDHGQLGHGTKIATGHADQHISIPVKVLSVDFVAPLPLPVFTSGWWSLPSWAAGQDYRPGRREHPLYDRRHTPHRRQSDLPVGSHNLCRRRHPAPSQSLRAASRVKPSEKCSVQHRCDLRIRCLVTSLRGFGDRGNGLDLGPKRFRSVGRRHMGHS